LTNSYKYRGFVHKELGNNEEAIADLEKYLELESKAEDTAEIEAMIEELKGGDSQQPKPKATPTAEPTKEEPTKEAPTATPKATLEASETITATAEATATPKATTTPKATATPNPTDKATPTAAAEEEATATPQEESAEVENAEVDNTEPLIVQGDGYRGVILPAAIVEDSLDPAADAHWTPNEEDVANFEAGIADYLKEAAADRSPDLWEKQATYGRQYIGIERDGKQLIYASFFCDIRTENDLKRLMVGQMIVADGGDCYFQVLFDPKSGEYSELMVNGEA